MVQMHCNTRIDTTIDGNSPVEKNHDICSCKIDSKTASSSTQQESELG
jgi:hypothetical protein